MTRNVTTLEHDVIPTDELEWNKYRKCPVVVSAAQMDVPFMVETLEGWSQGRSGDWLIEGALEELYPCNDAVFRATYKRAETHAVGYDKPLDLVNEYFLTSYDSWDEIDRGQLVLFLSTCLTVVKEFGL